VYRQAKHDQNAHGQQNTFPPIGTKEEQVIHDWGWEAERLGHSNRIVKMRFKEIKQVQRGKRGASYVRKLAAGESL